MKISSKELLSEDVIDNAIENEIIDHTRWSVVHSIVFKWTDGKHYSASYSKGATECQDEGPWEYEDEVNCQEVELREVKVTQWMPVAVPGL